MYLYACLEKVEQQVFLVRILSELIATIDVILPLLTTPSKNRNCFPNEPELNLLNEDLTIYAFVVLLNRLFSIYGVLYIYNLCSLTTIAETVNLYTSLRIKPETITKGQAQRIYEVILRW